MIDKERFVKYKPRLEKTGKLYAISGILGICSILLFLFVPLFKIQGEKADQIFRFSIFNEFILNVELFMNDLGVWDFLAIYQVLSFLYIAFGLIMYSVDIFKVILKLRDINGYAIMEYDNIVSKTKKEENVPRKWNAMNNLIYGLILEIGYILIAKFIANSGDGMSFFDLNSYNASSSHFQSSSYLFSYFAFANGFTILFYIISSIFVTALIFMFVARYKKEKIKLDIVKDEYGDFLNGYRNKLEEDKKE